MLPFSFTFSTEVSFTFSTFFSTGVYKIFHFFFTGSGSTSYIEIDSDSHSETDPDAEATLCSSSLSSSNPPRPEYLLFMFAAVTERETFFDFFYRFPFFLLLDFFTIRPTFTLAPVTVSAGAPSNEIEPSKCAILYLFIRYFISYGYITLSTTLA